MGNEAGSARPCNHNIKPAAVMGNMGETRYDKDVKLNDMGDALQRERFFQCQVRAQMLFVFDQK